MKKIVSVLLVIMSLFVMLCGCEEKQSLESQASSESSEKNSEFMEESTIIENGENFEHLYREHQELTTSEIVFNDNNMMRISIPEVGLENIFVQKISDLERVCDEGYGYVYLLADDRYGGGRFPCDLYLAIEFGGKLFFKDLSEWEDCASYYVDMNLCDVNNDPDVEIVLNVCVSNTGGNGNYLSRVFDFENGEIVEMFSSCTSGEDFDTGFSITVLDNKEFKIENKFTGYSENFEDTRETDEYYKNYWYDENGVSKGIELWVDSFYQFSPIDIDQDGVYEILCRQYVCLVDHTDGLGTATSILKYDKDIGDFKIINTKFEYNKYY